LNKINLIVNEKLQSKKKKIKNVKNSKTRTLDDWRG
jgi:hypothetical protein